MRSGGAVDFQAVSHALDAGQGTDRGQHAVDLAAQDGTAQDHFPVLGGDNDTAGMGCHAAQVCAHAFGQYQVCGQFGGCLLPGAELLARSRTCALARARVCAVRRRAYPKCSLTDARRHPPIPGSRMDFRPAPTAAPPRSASSNPQGGNDRRAGGAAAGAKSLFLESAARARSITRSSMASFSRSAALAAGTASSMRARARRPVLRVLCRTCAPACCPASVARSRACWPA